MINKFLKYIILSIFVITALFSSAFAKCSNNDKCSNNNSSYSDCVDLLFDTVPQAFENYLSSIEHRPYGEYEYEIITKYSIADSMCYEDDVYYVYKSLEPIYYDNSASQYVLPAGTVRVEIFTFGSQCLNYPVYKNSCVGRHFGVPSFNQSPSQVSSLGEDMISCNYDICDNNGNVVVGKIDNAGYIEIVTPQHNGDKYVQVGSNKVDLGCYYSYANYNSMPPVVDIFGVDTYDFVDTDFAISDDGSRLYGNCYYSLTLPYNKETKVGVCFYDDMEVYHEDVIYITCYNTVYEVPPGTDIDIDTNVSGGSNGGFLSNLKNFFSGLGSMFSDLTDFFTGFTSFLSNSFSFLPTIFITLISIGLVLTLLLRILGR